MSVVVISSSVVISGLSLNAERSISVSSNQITASSVIGSPINFPYKLNFSIK